MGLLAVGLLPALVALAALLGFITSDGPAHDLEPLLERWFEVAGGSPEGEIRVLQRRAPSAVAR